jgi:1,4-dihydroxy-2-naphthoate polyprenyltransferase
MTARPSAFQVWWEAARPRTLPAAIAPVLAGSALAARDGAFVPAAAGLCLGFALLIQIGTNFANDYFDHAKGADTAERLGPPRAVAAGWVSPALMWRVMGVTFAAAFAVGLGLLVYGGPWLLVVGLASIACGVAYTGGPYPLAYHGWGDVFVFIFFGLVAVTMTYFVQAGTITAGAWVLGAGIGALATTILVVNNYRDEPTDRHAGKRTTTVRFGRGFAVAEFITLHVVAIGALLSLAGLGLISPIVALVLASMAGIAGALQTQLLRQARARGEWLMLLGLTGRHLAFYALGVAAALLFT